MKAIRTLLLLATIGGASLAGSAALAHEGHKKETSNETRGELVPVSEKDAAWAAKQKTEHPTSVCVVSDDKLGGDMGEPVDYIYRVQGKPDRLISFCCKDCVKDFNKEPNKYLSILDRSARGTKGAEAHSQHQH